MESIEDILKRAAETEDDVGREKLYRIAAEQGSAEAQNKLGDAYFHGWWGVVIDYEEAFLWYRKAAEQGNYWSQMEMGQAYKEGKFLDQNIEEAVEWFKKAAEQVNTNPLKELQALYKEGKISEQVYKESLEIFRMAALRGNRENHCALGHYYESLENNLEEAFKWYRKSAEQGDDTAQKRLGECYYNGKGVAQDYGEAFKWYKKSADQSCGSTPEIVAGLYKFGIGVEQNDGEAIKWYSKHNDADINFEHFDPPAVGYIEWYHNAAKHGNVPAQLKLGYYYLYGLVCGDGRVEKNIDEAIKWYSKAAEQGSTEAHFKLGEVHLGYTPGIEEDKEAALEWFEKATELGDIYAKEYAIGLGERMRARSDKHDKPFSLVALLRSITFMIHSEKWPPTAIFQLVEALDNPGEDFTTWIPTQIIRDIFLSLRQLAKKGMMMFTFNQFQSRHPNRYYAPQIGTEDYEITTAEHFCLLEYRPLLFADRNSHDLSIDYDIPIFYTQYLDESGRLDSEKTDKCMLYFAKRPIWIENVHKECSGKPEAPIKVGKYDWSAYYDLAHTVSGIFCKTHKIITKEDIREIWD